VFLMTRGLPLLFELGLTIFCLIDCVQTPATITRNLPKWAWIALILVFPLIGSIAWLIVGRPGAADRDGRPSGDQPGHDRYPRSRRPRSIAPDDDPEFLRELGRLNTEHKEPPTD
jgi:hypothetical protein